MKTKFVGPKDCPRTVYCYDKAGSNGLSKDALQYIPWDSIISCDDIDSSATDFQDLVLAAVDMHIPKMKLRHKSTPPWIDKDVLTLVRKKKSLMEAPGSGQWIC